MDQNLDSGDSVRAVVETYVADAVVAGLILLLGIIVVVTSLELGAGWTSDGPGSGYFPFGIGVILSISGAVTMIQSLFGKNKDRSCFVDTEQLSRVMQVLIPAIIYVGAIEVIGVYIASAVYIALFMILLGKFSIVKSVTIGVLTQVFFFGMFEVWFKVPLYKGYIDLLTFLGYS
tara:strand:+ start:136498 stop:137022 length:525 start_codon:yes stop_codon:yes gene_type:complete